MLFAKQRKAARRSSKPTFRNSAPTLDVMVNNGAARSFGKQEDPAERRATRVGQEGCGCFRFPGHPCCSRCTEGTTAGASGKPSEPDKLQADLRHTRKGRGGRHKCIVVTRLAHILIMTFKVLLPMWLWLKIPQRTWLRLKPSRRLCKAAAEHKAVNWRHIQQHPATCQP